METGVVGANSHQLSDSTPDDAGNNRETAIVEVDGSHVKITNYDLLADMREPTVWEWDVADSLDDERPVRGAVPARRRARRPHRRRRSGRRMTRSS